MFIGNDAGAKYAGGMIGGALNGGSYQQAPETACRESEVPGEAKRLANAIEELGLVVEQLSARLSPIRRTVGNSIGKDQTSPPEPVMCELAAVIRNQRQGIERHTSTLRTALNELEI